MDPEDSDRIPINDDDDEEDLTTAAQVVQKLQEVWVNEKLSPELLNYEDELVDCLIDQVQHMENSLQAVKKDDFRLVCHKMELDRIKFVLNSYFRTRLEKIEKYGAYLLKMENDEPGRRVQLSEEERKFAEEYFLSIKKYLHDVALQHMPANMQSLPLEDAGPKPQLSKSVFIRAKKDCQGVLLETSDYGMDEVITLRKGSQHILQYKTVASLLKRGSVQLI